MDLLEDLRSRPSMPQRGDIVSCRFPLDENPRAPGPKARPVLVVNHRFWAPTNTHLLTVVYGTTRVDGRRPAQDEFLLRNPESLRQAGLHHATKFVIGRHRELAFDNDFFAFNRHQSAILGRLMPADKAQLDMICARLVQASPQHYRILQRAA